MGVCAVFADFGRFCVLDASFLRICGWWDRWLILGSILGLGFWCRSGEIGWDLWVGGFLVLGTGVRGFRLECAGGRFARGLGVYGRNAGGAVIVGRVLAVLVFWGEDCWWIGIVDRSAASAVCACGSVLVGFGLV